MLLNPITLTGPYVPVVWHYHMIKQLQNTNACAAYKIMCVYVDMQPIKSYDLLDNF